MAAVDHLNSTQHAHYFHATNPENLESIKEHGLQSAAASEGQRPGVYGYHQLDWARSYGGRKSAVIEFKPSAVLRHATDYTVTESIPPENIVKIHGPEDD